MFPGIDQESLRDVLLAHVCPELKLRIFLFFCAANKNLLKLQKTAEKNGGDIWTSMAKNSFCTGLPLHAAAPSQMFPYLQELSRVHTTISSSSTSTPAISSKTITVWEGNRDPYAAPAVPSHNGRLLISQHALQLRLYQLDAASAQPAASPIWQASMADLPKPEQTAENLRMEPWPVIDEQQEFYAQMVWAPDDKSVVIWLSIEDDRESGRLQLLGFGWCHAVYILDVSSKQLQFITRSLDSSAIMWPIFSPNSELLAVPWNIDRGIVVEIFERSVSTQITGRGNIYNYNSSNLQPSALSSARTCAYSWTPGLRIPDPRAISIVQWMKTGSVCFSPDSKYLAIARGRNAEVYQVDSPDIQCIQTAPLARQYIEEGGDESIRITWSANGRSIVYGQSGADPSGRVYFGNQPHALHFFGGSGFEQRTTHDMASARAAECLQVLSATPYGFVGSTPEPNCGCPWGRGWTKEPKHGRFVQACIFRNPEDVQSATDLLVAELPKGLSEPALSPDGAFLALMTQPTITKAGRQASKKGLPQLHIYSTRSGQCLLKQALSQDLKARLIETADENVHVRMSWPMPGRHILIATQWVNGPRQVPESVTSDQIITCSLG